MMKPLMAAAKAGQGGVIRILLAAGADASILGGLGNEGATLESRVLTYYDVDQGLASISGQT